MTEQTITDSSATFTTDMMGKRSIIKNCETGERLMIKRIESGTIVSFYPAWKAVCIGLWIKLIGIFKF